MSILNYIEKIKQENEGPRITIQEPRNMAHGGMIGKPGGLVEEGVEYYSQKIYEVTTGARKGEWALAEPTWHPATKTKSTKNRYFKSKTDLNNYLKETKTPPKYSKTELNKAAKFFYDKDEVSSPKFDELDVKSREWNKVYDRVRGQKGKFSRVTQADALRPAQQAKILKEYPDAKFTPKNKYGFPPGHENYQKVVAFVTKGYKRPFQGSQLQALPKYAQKELIEAFPEVDFNFDRDTLLRKGSQFSKYGVPVSHPKYSKISKYFAKSKVWKYNFDLRSPEGWMMSQMERNYAQNGEASPYRPITKKGGPIAKGNPMIGIEHNGKKYNMKTIVDHDDFANTKKYWNIADKTSKKYLSEFDNLAKLLPEGFDPKKIQLNDLLQFIGDKDGVNGLNRAKRAIQIHHEYGVGPRATTNYQLLRQDMNLLANKTNNLLKSKDLSKVEKGAAQALERNTRLVVDDVRYGPEKVSARGDIKSIISQAESELKKFTKKDWNKFGNLLNIKSGDNAAMITSKIKKAPIPNKVKGALLGMVGAFGTITGADFLKKSGILFDQEFEQTASAVDAPIVEKGLGTAEKAAIGTGAALGVGTKVGRKFLGTALNLGFGPTGALALTYGLRPEGGYDLKRAGDRLGFEAEASFASPLVKGALSVTDKIKNPMLRKIAERGSLALMSPAMALRLARVATPLGIASLAGEGLWHLGKKGYSEHQKMKGMTEQEKSDYLAQRYEDLGGVYGEGAADGGRIGRMGGGMVGIRRPHAIPPERQGLRSIMINGKKS